MFRWRYPVAVGCLLVAAGGYLYWRREGDGARAGYVSEIIDRGRVAAVVTATGTVNPVTAVQVGTYVSGPIRNIFVDFNSPVRRGQPVAKIDPAPFQVKVRQAEASAATARARVAKSRADLALKKLALDRARALHAKDVVAQYDVDAATSDYDQAVAQVALDEAGVSQADAALDEARINLAYTDITSPVDGVVVSRNVDVGQTVAASFQTPTLFLIAGDLTKMQVNAAVSESDVGAVRSGQAAAFVVDAYPEREFRGSVAQVRNAPVSVQNVVTYDVVVSVENPDLALKPGMTAMVTIVTAARDDAVRIPLRAVRFKPERSTAAEEGQPGNGAGDGASTVWVLGADEALRAVSIATGIRDDRFAELISGGVRPGDAVAVALRQVEEGPKTQMPFFGPRRR